MLSLMTFLAGLLATVALGAPVVGRIASPEAWRGWRKGQPSDAIAPPKHKVVRSFQPLDLGPDPTHWPSERPWEPSRLKEMAWPSQSWDDEHFGAHWRKQPGSSPPKGRVVERVEQAAREWFDGAKEAAEQLAESAAGQEATAKMRQATEQIARAQAAAGKTARRAHQAAEKAAKVAQSSAPKQVKAAARKAEELAVAVEAQAARAQKAAAGAGEAVNLAKAAMAGQPPSREEIQQFVNEYGLAGAVKKVMDRTGWDFRAAAQYLSQNR